jgi:hypothetical protein
MRGDILLFDDRPVAMELLYGHETPRWLFINGVQRVSDREFWSHSVGSVLTFRNLEQLEDEARVRNKILRYCYGWNDARYKAAWAFTQPSYRLRYPRYSVNGDQTGDGNRYTPLEQTEWRFTELDFAKIETLEAHVQRIQDTVLCLERTTQELATKSFKTIDYLLERVDDICRQFDRVELNRQYLARRSILEQIFFRSDGRPIKPLRRLLFHTSGKPRAIFRRLVLRENGTPRRVFCHWMQNPASVPSHLGRKFDRDVRSSL